MFCVSDEVFDNFLKGKKNRGVQELKERQSSERKQFLELKIIPYFFQQAFITDLLCDLFLC